MYLVFQMNDGKADEVFKGTLERCKAHMAQLREADPAAVLWVEPEDGYEVVAWG